MTPPVRPDRSAVKDVPAVQREAPSTLDRLLIAIGADPGFADAVLGDLAEEHALRAARDGAAAARTWYIVESLRSVPHLLQSRARRATRAECVRLTAYLAVATLAAAIGLIAIARSNGPPARLAAGASGYADTVVVNNVEPVRIPLRVLDAQGHLLASAGVRYQRTSGAALPVSENGTVTCTQRGDAVVRASLGLIATSLFLRCRPVDKLYLDGVIELIAGDSAQLIPVEALGKDRRRVDLLAGSTRILDSSIATLEGLRIRPRSPGGTLAGVFIGDRGGWVQVEVYKRVGTPEGIRQDHNLMVPVRLGSGDMRKWRLPAGSYILSMRPEGSALRFALINGDCGRIPFVRAYLCAARADASVIVYNPWRNDPVPAARGELALRRLTDVDDSVPASR